MFSSGEEGGGFPVCHPVTSGRGGGFRSFSGREKRISFVFLLQRTHNGTPLSSPAKQQAKERGGKNVIRRQQQRGKKERKRKKKTTSKRQQQVININGGLIYEPAEGVYSFHPKGEKTRTDLCKYRSPLLLSFLRLFSLFLFFFLSVYCIFTCREPVA